MEMGKKMYKEFIRSYDETFESIKSLLESENLNKFRLACNYLVVCSYTSDCEIKLRQQIELREIANAIIRKKFTSDVAEMYDMIVHKSKQELWGGDELYKLYAYDIIPYYVRSCIKSALSVMALMKKGVSTVNDAMLVAELVHHPLYWDLYENSVLNSDDEHLRLSNLECKAWGTIGEYLFNGEYAKAFNFMQNCQQSKYADPKRFGDNFRSIGLEKFPE